MAISSTAMLPLLLLTLAATQASSGEDRKLDGLELVAPLKGVSHALGCFGNVMEESLRLQTRNAKDLHESLNIQRQNSESLMAVTKLTELVLQQNKNIDSMNEELATLRNAEHLAEENANLKILLANEVKKVAGTVNHVAWTTRTTVLAWRPATSHLFTVAKKVLRGQRFTITASVEAHSSVQRIIRTGTPQTCLTMVEDLAEQLKQSGQLAAELSGRNQILNNTVVLLDERILAENKENYQSILKVQELEQRLRATRKENEQTILMVQELERKLNESQGSVEELRTKLELLSRTVVTEVQEGCELPDEDTIRKKVQEYNRTKDWKTLRSYLGGKLSRGSKAYIQLQDIEDTNTAPLYWVGRDTSMELAKVLVFCGQAVNVADSYGRTILYGTAFTGDVKMAAWLVDHGADIEKGYDGGWTPLMNAAGFGRLEFVKYLVQVGASTTASNKDNKTALDWAKTQGQTEVVQYLSQLPH